MITTSLARTETLNAQGVANTSNEIASFEYRKNDLAKVLPVPYKRLVLTALRAQGHRMELIERLRHPDRSKKRYL
ncbi:uncharacterized protein PHALS_14100 [Plasmopara halstedii]|uniref:Uncharacterized protein n=1 Tax=Plasmopara halstedii TaxID=4781 RepID=A0A0P1AQG6_PLAHL|nr:uncharacterized protein PHALS_14100 [Plasmopara halstedii]CEG43809.1 hypothetical protein PHALS_14100 [Plasmopara halstedii]|eukprot:XP_024580178.1 hypothetical protein PHALS_14100 [Plasmopara halstedii]